MNRGHLAGLMTTLASLLAACTGAGGIAPSASVAPPVVAPARRSRTRPSLLRVGRP